MGRLMILPNKEFYRIQEVATAWSENTGHKILVVDIANYIGQGLLPAYVHYGK